MTRRSLILAFPDSRDVSLIARDAPDDPKALRALRAIACGTTPRPRDEQLEAIRYLDVMGLDLCESDATIAAEMLLGSRAVAVQMRRGCTIGVLGRERCGAGASFTGALLDAARRAA